MQHPGHFGRQHRRRRGPGALRRAAGAAAASRVPKGTTVFTTEEAVKAADELGYPVLLRPSYVLGGQNMIIAYSESDVREYMGIITCPRDGEPRPDRQVPHGYRGGSRRHLRRQRLSDPRHHGAYRACRRPLGRLHLGLPGPDPEPEDPRHHHRLHRSVWPAR